MIDAEHYTITRERLPTHEMIGLNVRVSRSGDHNKVGITGKIVDETQRLFIIETKQGEKRIPKNESIFAFTLGKETVELNGKQLLYSPIERLKKGERHHA